jgi:hypothetical protein
MTIIIESGNPIDVFINNQSPVIENDIQNVIVSPDIHDIVIENVTARGFEGIQGATGAQGIQGIQGVQGIPGTGISQINAGPVANNNTILLDSLDLANYISCQWIVTVIDTTAMLYRSGVISATIDSWSHYAIVGDSIQYRLTVTNLTLSITNNHPNPLLISLIRLPIAKP